MASQFIPIRGSAFTFEVPGFYSQADPTVFKVNPTIAAGDFKISKDGGNWAALTNTPTVINADTMVQFVLTATEMTADRVAIKWVDAAGAEWIAGSITFYTAAVGADALARTTDVTAVETDTQDIQSRLPAALVGGRIDASVGAMAAGAVQAIWDALTAALTTVGSIGKLLVDNINATIGSRATQASVDAIDTALPSDPADQSVLEGLLATLQASADAAARPGAAMTLEVDAVTNATVHDEVPLDFADKLLGRNINGGSSVGRLVKDALKRLRNRVYVAAGVMHITEDDDAADAWTANVTTAAGDPITDVDPT